MNGVALSPKRPPGRSSRKAAAYRGEIQRLQLLGYTLDAIREALADAGVVVSKSTVQREAARKGDGTTAATPSPRASASGTQRAAKDSAHSAPEPDPATAAPAHRQSGREIAEAFVRTRISNPLLRKDPP